MPTPTEHKTVQARILAYAEAILLCAGYGGQVGWTLLSEGKKIIGDSKLEIWERRVASNSESLSSLCSLRFSISEFRGLNRRERRDRKEDLESDSLCSLRSLRLDLFGHGIGLNRRERRERKEDFDWSSWRQAVAKSGGRKFSRRLCEKYRPDSRHFCNSLLQKSHIV